MKDELKQTLARQAAWQRARSAEKWAEKLHTAVVMRQALLALRKGSVASPGAAARSQE